MTQTVRALIGFVLAAALPALCFGVFSRSATVAYIAFALAGLFVALLGLPLFLVLHRLNRVNFWTTLFAGFLIAAIPIGIYSWPFHHAEKSAYSAWDGANMVTYVVDGVPTRAGWLLYGRDTIELGLLGAASGLAFWIVWGLKWRTRKANV